jgi:hypothetical protein
LFSSIKKGAEGKRKKEEEEIRKKITTRGKTMEWTFSFVKPFFLIVN